MDILDRIKQLRDQRHWTEYKLAEMSGLPQTTISSWYRKNMLPSIHSLEQICAGFGITMSQFFFDAEQEPYALTSDQREMLKIWDVLTPQQKESLLAFLRTI